MYREQLVATAEKVFFLAMKEGYAFGHKPVPHPIFSDWKQYPFSFVDDEGYTWCVIDEYNNEGGCTIITCESHVVWIMKYWGKYQKEAIPLLKAALARQYEKEEFLGGRGPRHFSQGGMHYQNFCGAHSSDSTVTRQSRPVLW